MQNALIVLAIVFYLISTIYFSIRFFLKKAKMRTLAFLFLLLGFFTHGLNLLVFALEQHRFPAASFVEASGTLTWLILLLFLLFSRRSEMDAAGVALLPVTVVSLLIGAFAPEPSNASIQPMIKGGWIYVHTPLMILSVASLTISFVMALMYLLQEKQLKSKHPAFLYYRLPSLEICEDYVYKSLGLGFFLLTFGIVTGMIWSKYLRNVYWSWDIKEVWAVITWGLYAILVQGRMLAAWRGRKAAYLAIIGFALILFTFAGVSLLSKGYHTF